MEAPEQRADSASGPTKGTGASASSNPAERYRTSLERKRFAREAAESIFASPLSLRGRLLRLAELAGTAISADNAVFYVTDTVRSRVSDLVSWGLNARQARWLRSAVVGTELDDSPFTRRLRANETIVVDDTCASEDTVSIYNDYRVRAFIAVPLWAGGPYLGALFVHFLDSPHEFGADEIDLIVELARQATLAIVVAQLHEQQQALRQMREELLGKITVAHELERRALASELHDSVVAGQAVSVAVLEEAQRTLATGDVTGARPLLDLAASRAREVLAMTRTVTQRLRPTLLEEHGLVSALSTMMGQIEASWRGRVHFESTLRERLDDDTELALYRIAQEATNNAVLHAGAKSITLRLLADDEATHLIVGDDGHGFDAGGPGEWLARGHFGVAIMAERAQLVGGWLDLVTDPEAGTTVHVRVGRRT